METIKNGELFLKPRKSYIYALKYDFNSAIFADDLWVLEFIRNHKYVLSHTCVEIRLSIKRP